MVQRCNPTHQLEDEHISHIFKNLQSDELNNLNIWKNKTTTGSRVGGGAG